MVGNLKSLVGVLVVLFLPIVPAVVAQDPLVSVDWDDDINPDGLNSGKMTGSDATLDVNMTSADGVNNGGITLGFDWASTTQTDGVPGINAPEVVLEFTVIDEGLGSNVITIDFAGGRIRNPILFVAFADDATVLEFPDSVSVSLIDTDAGSVVIDGSKITFSGNGTGISGFAVQLSGVFSQLIFNYTTEGVALDSLGLSIAALDSNILVPLSGDPVPGHISTVAGNGWAGFARDNVQAISTQLNNPQGLARDTDGNLYIADAANHRIRRVDATTGVITTVAGTGTMGFSGDGGLATAAELNAPSDVDIDGAGNLFIADADNNRIRKVAADTGFISTVASFATPLGVAVDPDGNLYAACADNRVRKIDTLSTVTVLAGDGTAGFAGDGGLATGSRLNFPFRVNLDAAGNLYIADTFNNRVRKIDATTGIISTVAGDGTSSFGGDGGLATAAQLASPTDAKVDGGGNLIISDSGNHRVRRIDAKTRIITTIAGTGLEGFSGDGSPATAAQLASPGALVFDAAGNLCIADFGNQRVRKIAKAGPDPNAAQKKSLLSKIRKLKRKIAVAKRKHQTGKAKRLERKLKRLKRKLRAL